jgi:hypothetical protein
MTGYFQLVSTVASFILLLVVLELVRQRRLFERYAILWLFSALVLIGLALRGDVLQLVSNALGIASPPNALFVTALGFVLVLLLHFSVAVSRLSDQSKVLAQRLALLEERLRQQAAAGSDYKPATAPTVAAAKPAGAERETVSALPRRRP